MLIMMLILMLILLLILMLILMLILLLILMLILNDFWNLVCVCVRVRRHFLVRPKCNITQAGQ